MRGYLLAALLVLPFALPNVWSGFSLAMSDPVLAAVSPWEQPLTVRTPGALWAVGALLVWFGLAYGSGRVAWWEAALVVLGSAAALARAANVWVLGVAMIVPLARQLGQLRVNQRIVVAACGLCAAATIAATVLARPPSLPSDAAVPATGPVLADWRWAPDLQHRLDAQHVFGAGGLRSESEPFWLDYLRVTEGHERWADILRGYDVSSIAVDAHAPVASLLRESGEWHVTYDANGALVAVR